MANQFADMSEPEFKALFDNMARWVRNGPASTLFTIITFGYGGDKTNLAKYVSDAHRQATITALRAAADALEKVGAV